MPNDILIGPAGWSYDDWKGIVYPTSREPGFHEAAYLAQYFSTIEINTSFYRPLRPEVARVWVKKLAGRPGFRFTAKLFRGLTHERRLERESVSAYRAGLDPLIDAGLLGCVLMQFPFSFRYNRENLAYLLRLARELGGYRLVAELRHSGWNNEDALSALADHGVGFCNIDQPQLNGCMPPTAHVTSSVGYVRLHGRNYEQWFNFNDAETPRTGMRAVEARYDYLYSAQQLEKWRARIERVASQAETTYVVTNNHFRGQAVVNALQILSSLEGEPVDAPPNLQERYPELQSCARNVPRQRSLFFAERRRDPQPSLSPVRRQAIAASYAAAW